MEHTVAASRIYIRDPKGVLNLIHKIHYPENPAILNFSKAIIGRGSMTAIFRPKNIFNHHDTG
ncbi:hypothetical protein [Methylomicrobium sp. Wu6]|uniref:hypothetical protein n=1 Tax=Methylomicrobium sp. Wu6 TaxID=3107928 RepID=UPI002DD63E04|nr:hypothetical protein [Methylomicrobium sp. Wu6]MEC4747252.1 hypothetical protein [Methylomicrobium sp. Wu6]